MPDFNYFFLYTPRTRPTHTSHTALLTSHAPRIRLTQHSLHRTSTHTLHTALLTLHAPRTCSIQHSLHRTPTHKLHTALLTPHAHTHAPHGTPYTARPRTRPTHHSSHRTPHAHAPYSTPYTARSTHMLHISHTERLHIPQYVKKTTPFIIKDVVLK